MKIIRESEVFENKLPQLRSRQAFFPYLAQDESGRLLCTLMIGEALESVDSTTYITESADGGVTWSEPRQIFDKTNEDPPVSDMCKITWLGGGEAICLGYGYYRDDPSLPEGNPETGGLLDDLVFYTRSTDGGKTWDGCHEIKTHWPNSTEASAPVTVLQNGDYVSPITGFPDWNGKMHGKMCGRLLVSHDRGKTWNDDVICMEFEGDSTTCYEQRLCQLESGELVVIGWNEDTATGKRLHNHFTLSRDNGKSFSAPRDTGIAGQASSVCALEGSKLFALHAIRRDSDRPGVYGYLVDLADGNWNILEELLVWEPNAPVLRDRHMADTFAFLKFGQPSAIRLKNGNLAVVFWYAENGQHKVKMIEIGL